MFCSQRVNHGMLAVGYGTSQERGRNVSYWILKNRLGAEGVLPNPPPLSPPCTACPPSMELHGRSIPVPQGALAPVPVSLALPEQGRFSVRGNTDVLILHLFLQLVGGVGRAGLHPSAEGCRQPVRGGQPSQLPRAVSQDIPPSPGVSPRPGCRSTAVSFWNRSFCLCMVRSN